MNVADIKAKVRKITGRPSTEQLSDADLLTYINMFYQEIMPAELPLADLRDTLLWTTTAGQSDYTLPVNFIEIDGYRPAYCNDLELKLYSNLRDFRTLYPFSNTLQKKPASMYYDSAARQIILKPTPDAVYNIRLPIFTQPDALVYDTDVPKNPRWALWIAYGTALQIFNDADEMDNVDKYTNMYEFYKTVSTRRFGENISSIGRW